MTQLVLASNNQKKRDELARALTPHLPGVTVLTLSDVGVDSPVEDADSFVGNALVKARHCVQHTGLATLADDSGLAVDVLDGAPGVYSARFAGDGATDTENNHKLINTLTALGLPGPFRAAFHAAVVFVTPEGSEHVATGVMPGVVTTTARGVNGFGYDPLFYADAYDNRRSNAELTTDEKQAVSHRGQALVALLPAVVAWLTQTTETPPD
jgi:XTP/dITP diphosphohydrolase